MAGMWDAAGARQAGRELISGITTQKAVAKIDQDFKIYLSVLRNSLSGGPVYHRMEKIVSESVPEPEEDHCARGYREYCEIRDRNEAERQQKIRERDEAYERDARERKEAIDRFWDRD